MLSEAWLLASLKTGLGHGMYTNDSVESGLADHFFSLLTPLNCHDAILHVGPSLGLQRFGGYTVSPNNNAVLRQHTPTALHSDYEYETPAIASKSTDYVF
jgi:hypothetical protein